MPDITMCDDTDCPRFKECYRAQAEPTPSWQSYFETSPRKGTECAYFMLDTREGRN